MARYLYGLRKYVAVEVEAESEGEAERKMWERVIEEGSEDLEAELLDVEDGAPVEFGRQREGLARGR